MDHHQEPPPPLPPHQEPHHHNAPPPHLPHQQEPQQLPLPHHHHQNAPPPQLPPKQEPHHQNVPPPPLRPKQEPHHQNAPPPPLPPKQEPHHQNAPQQEPQQPPLPHQAPVGRVKSIIIEPPFPWATSYRAKIHSLNYLTEHNITNIRGETRCSSCNREVQLDLALQDKLPDVCAFVRRYKPTMHDRAPPSWLTPVLPDCTECGKANSLHPVLTRKRSINWLFLLLGQTVGVCDVIQLRYFTRRRGIHVGGAKDQVLYRVYMRLMDDLIPGFC